MKLVFVRHCKACACVCVSLQALTVYMYHAGSCSCSLRSSNGRLRANTLTKSEPAIIIYIKKTSRFEKCQDLVRVGSMHEKPGLKMYK